MRVERAATRSAGVPSKTIRPPSWPALGPNFYVEARRESTETYQLRNFKVRIDSRTPHATTTTTAPNEIPRRGPI